MTREIKRRRHPAVRFLQTLGYLLLMSLVGLSGTALGWLNTSDVMGEALRQKALGVPPEQVFAEGGLQRDHLILLVLGCDEDRYYGGPARSRTAGQVLATAARSDMIMVVKLDFARDRITGVSIPRDLEVALPKYRARKINAYHAVGGHEGGPERAKELAKQAVESVVGVQVDRVVVLDFTAFQEVVDMMGGVRVDVPKDMKYTDRAAGLYIDLKKGPQVLDGYQAMGFVRFRHDDSDFARQERQRDLLLALKEQVMRKWQMSPRIIDKGLGVLGNAFTATELASLALFAQRVGEENVKITMVPVLPMRGTTNLALDTAKLPKTLREAGLARGMG